VAATSSAFGRLDVVVNNAGYIKANSVEDLNEHVTCYDFSAMP